MSLHEVVAARAFEPTADPVGLAGSHVWFERMSGIRLEKELYGALTGERPCAAEVRGPTGAGKSSTIMGVVSDVAKLRGPPEREVMLLRAGDAEEFLGDTGACARHVLQTIRAQGYRFADDAQERLAQLGAQETTVTDPVVKYGGRVEAGPRDILRASYQHDLQEAYAQRKYGTDPALARGELEEVLRIIRDGDVAPAVVIDDTDRFADPAPDGLNRDAVDGLFNNLLRLLADLGADFVVAVHPRFDEAGAYEPMAERLLTTRLEIPWLRLEERPIAAILEKHLRCASIEAPVDELVSEVAQHALWGAYAGGRRDIRLVMRAAAEAARNAYQRGAEAIEAEDVSVALERVPLR